MKCTNCKGEEKLWNPEWDYWFDKASDNIPDNDLCAQKADKLAPKYKICPQCNGTGEKEK